MKILYTVLILLSVVFLQGCHYPDAAKIEQKDSRPAIGVAGAPAGAVLFVDGLKMGLTSQFDGKQNVLLVESGTHLVEIKSANGQVLHSETLFLSGSTTKILQIKP